MKRIFYILLFLANNFYSQAPIVYNWQDSKEGWVSATEPNNGCQLFAQPESMAMRAYNETPIMRSGNLQANIGIEAANYNQVEITMKNPTTSNQNPTPNAILFVYPPESNEPICKWKFPVDTGMTEYASYIIDLESPPEDNGVFEGSVARFGLRAPWGVANFDTVYWKNMIVSNTNPVVDSVEITFNLDMTQVSESFSVPEINGDFNTWCGNCDVMYDLDGNNIWGKSINLFPGDTIEYKFSTDNFQLVELLNSDDECTNGNPNSTNRVLIVPQNNENYDFCWGSCDPCITSITDDKFKFSVYPNPVNSILNISSEKLLKRIIIKDIFDKTVVDIEPRDFFVDINIQNLTNNIYFLNYFSENKWFSSMIVVDN